MAFTPAISLREASTVLARKNSRHRNRFRLLRVALTCARPPTVMGRRGWAVLKSTSSATPFGSR